MCFSWIVVQIIVILFYKNLPDFKTKAHNISDDSLYQIKHPNESTPMISDRSEKFYNSVTSENDLESQCQSIDKRLDLDDVDFVKKPHEITLGKRLFNE